MAAGGASADVGDADLPVDPAGRGRVVAAEQDQGAAGQRGNFKNGRWKNKVERGSRASGPSRSHRVPEPVHTESPSKIIDPRVKNPGSAEWNQVFRMFELLL
ncbi:hypothetical protein [Haloechinothrix salitolerans]|uniref:Uncharacterized protein n=1 Tax=Haloechinothrix salitolerans TaxID=926830 RepID=A0ABW2BUZ1_9PSEU